MKGKISFLIIPSRTGKRRRLSISRNFLACMVLLGLLLAGSGIVGALKYNENQELKKKFLALEVEKSKYEAVSRKLQNTEKDEAAVRKLLGLQPAESETGRLSSQPAEKAEQE